MSDGLTFNTLRRANVARLPLFRNKQGDIVHSQPDGSDWSLSAWSNAVLGEGEALEDDEDEPPGLLSSSNDLVNKEHEKW